MRKLVVVLLVLGLVSLLVPAAMAANSATQTITFEVQAINEISVSGNPAALIVSAATAGSQPNEVSNALTTYAITTNGTSKKITGALDAAMPSGVTLEANLAAPTVGTSAGDVALTAVAQDMVTGIAEVADASSAITYTLGATVAAGVLASDTCVVTYTIADGV